MRKEEQVLFGVSPRSDGSSDVLLGISDASWEYMKDGKTHTFDLRTIGLPIRIIMCGGRNHIQIKGWIDKHNRSLGLNTIKDMTDKDFGIKPE